MYLLRLSGKNGRAWRKAFTDSPSIRPHAIRNPMLCVNSDFSTMMVPAGTKKTLVSGETVKPKKQFSLQSWPRTIEKTKLFTGPVQSKISQWCLQNVHKLESQSESVQIETFFRWIDECRLSTNEE